MKTLTEFLTKERSLILEHASDNVIPSGKPSVRSERLDSGWDTFYTHLVQTFVEQAAADKSFGGQHDPNPSHELLRRHESEMHGNAEAVGVEYSALNATVRQVVNGYGAICQAITRLAIEHNVYISNVEFQTLNLFLDHAIADAVTAFSARRTEAVEAEEVKRLGFLAHELRNALGSALLALDMITTGVVGSKGETAGVLRMNFGRMTQLIDRALTEVRLRADPEPFFEAVSVIDIVSSIELTAAVEAKTKQIQFNVSTEPDLVVWTDRHLLSSAIANLVQNAIKYTQPNRRVQIRSFRLHDRIAIEVEDECGGLSEGKADELFEVFSQRSFDRSGLGLGLAIADHAAQKIKAQLSVKDLPGVGCIFCLLVEAQREISESGPIEHMAQA